MNLYSSNTLSSIVKLVFVLMILLFVLVFSLLVSTGLISVTPFKQANLPTQQPADLKDIAGRLDKLENQLSIVTSITGTVGITNTAELTTELIALKLSINNLDKRFSRVENLLMRNPETAIEIPLIRRDLDDLKSASNTQYGYLSQRIDFSFTLIIGSFVTLIATLLATALPSAMPVLLTWINQKTKPDEAKQSDTKTERSIEPTQDNISKT